MTEHDPSLIRTEHEAHMKEAKKRGFYTAFAEDVCSNWGIILGHVLWPEEYGMISAHNLWDIYAESHKEKVGFDSMNEMIEGAQDYVNDRAQRSRLSQYPEYYKNLPEPGPAPSVDGRDI